MMRTTAPRLVQHKPLLIAPTTPFQFRCVRATRIEQSRSTAVPESHSILLGNTFQANTFKRKNIECRAVGRTAFSVETNRLLKLILTRQAIKTLMNYLSETNGELHFWLHNYWSEHPLPLDPRIDPDDWIVELACCPLTKVNDPRRSSVVSAAAVSAVMHGEREVSPR